MIGGADVGGTFTDLVVWDGERLRVGKTPTTVDQSEGVVEGTRRLLDGGGLEVFLHGTTTATNALLERRGAPTALVTTAGFEDVVEIARQDRPSLYDPFADRPEPLVARDRRIGVEERIDHEGRHLAEPVDLSPLARLDEDEEVAAVAVVLLHAYRDDSHERRVADAIVGRRSDLAVSTSSAVVPEHREYERTSTTVLNAYLTPVVSRYLERLVARARDAGLPEDVLVMRSSGGLIPAALAARLPAAILLSGPAAGVVATASLGAVLGLERLISFDMGGTSTDVCRIDHGRPQVRYERPVGGLPCRMPSVAIHTVGAGGGSIAWRDPGGALRVGPRSAGAHPGPACYGRGGTDPTVTDADVVLGRLDPELRLGGEVPIDASRAWEAVARLGARVGLDAETTAAGIVEVVEAHMERAVRAVTVEEGADPRPAWLVAFGGAGGLHATALARRLEMRGVIVPPYGGVFSALGLLLSPARVDRAATVVVRADATDVEARLRATAETVRAAAVDELRRELVRAPSAVTTVVDARYVGQSHETSIPWEPTEPVATLVDRFHRAHEERNGFARILDPVEIVTVRVEATADPALTWADLPAPRPEGPARLGVRGVLHGGRTLEATRWRRAGLAPGERIAGPAVIEEDVATTWIGPGETAEVDGTGALIVRW